jgi:acyl-CoA thioester hydrolase
MTEYQKKVEIRWSDLDPNFHLRHSVYYDFGAYLRISFMNENGLTPFVMQSHQIGPILFREECVFKREIHFNDQVHVNLQLVKSTVDFSRWTMQHEIWKNKDTLSAIITIDGAWLNTAARKLTIPPAEFSRMYEVMPRVAHFEWVEHTPKT